MMDEMSASLFLDWAEFDRVCPFGEDRADLRSGIVAWTVATVASGLGGKKGGRTPKLQDFIPKFGTEAKRVQSVDEMKARLNAFAMAHNAFIAQKK